MISRKPGSVHNLLRASLTGGGILIIVRADRREEFARTARPSREDREAERAFLISKIELVRSDPQLDAAEKECAVAALQSRVDALADDGA